MNPRRSGNRAAWGRVVGLTPVRRDSVALRPEGSLLRAGPVQFVHDEFVGPLRWVPSEERIDSCKQTVQPRLTHFAPGGHTDSDDFPSGYVIASLWRAAGTTTPHVLITEYH